MITDIVKGDTINLQCSVGQSIAGWKIRCELYDKSGNSIELANSASGGSDDDIETTDAANGVFIVHIAKNLTTDFDDLSYIEIEVETDTNELFTPYQDDIKFNKERITWTEPS